MVRLDVVAAAVSCASKAGLIWVGAVADDAGTAAAGTVEMAELGGAIAAAGPVLAGVVSGIGIRPAIGQ